MKKIKFVTAIVLSAIIFATPVCQAYAADDQVTATESVSESTDDSSASSESAPEQSSDPAEDSSTQNSIQNSTPYETSSENDNDAAAELSTIGGSDTEPEDNDATALGTEASDNAVGSNAGGDEDESQDDPAVGSGDARIDTSGGGYFSYSGDISDDLTILLSGLDASNTAKTIVAINKCISGILENGTHVDFANSSFVDAEKFNIFVDGYDANHCWAATCANILWTTGYAQKAVNPLTNQYFSSEDEVLNYFSENFTDAAGVPTEGCQWFITGDYSLNNMENVAHTTKENSGGLLPEYSDFSSRSFLTYLLGDNSTAINALENVTSCGMGVLVRWFLDNGNISDTAHWMTVVGTVIDETAEAVCDRYKAIILANSDNNPVNLDTINTVDDLNKISSSDKLAAKSACDNKYTVYKLTYDSDKKWWTIDNFSQYSQTIITYLYTLLDSSESQQNGGGMDVPEVIVSEDTHEIFVIEESNDANMTIDYFYSLTSESLNTPENIAQLHNYMVENNVPVFLPSKGVVSEGQNLDVYVTAPQTFIYGVSADDAQIPFDAFYIEESDAGLTRLMIRDSYLKLLSKGKHIIRVMIQGSDTPVEFEINVI